MTYVLQVRAIRKPVEFRGRHQGLQASLEDRGKWLPDPIISMKFPCTMDNNLRSALEPFTTPAIVTVQHSFRHTHATLLGEVGESLCTAQAILGHSDLKTTLNVYTHAIPESRKRAVDKVAGLLFFEAMIRFRSSVVAGSSTCKEAVKGCASNRRRRSAVKRDYPSRCFAACQQIRSIRQPFANTRVIFVTPWMRSW